MSSQVEEATLKRYRTVVDMKYPWIDEDDYPRKPTKTQMLEVLLQKLQSGEVDSLFTVKIKEV